MGRRVINMMTERANQREQFGKPIGEFQMIQQMLADSLIELLRLSIGSGCCLRNRSRIGSS